MNPLIQLNKTTPPLLITLALVCFGLVRKTQAVTPPPDGGYPGANTAEGDNALFNLTTRESTIPPWVPMRFVTILPANITWRLVLGRLQSNTTGNFNMAIGTEALSDNNANFNLAIGFRVVFMNTTGNHLTGIGAAALRNNTTAGFNTAIGADALRENTTGENNTAIGADALHDNTIGGDNTATGVNALASNTTGGDNTANGFHALC